MSTSAQMGEISMSTAVYIHTVYSGTSIMVTGGTTSVLIRGVVLISGVVLYTPLCSWDYA